MQINSKIRFYFYLSLLIAAIAAMLVLRAQILKERDPNIRDLNEIIESKELIIVTEPNSVGYYQEGDDFSGLQYELIQEFANEIGVKATILLDVDLERSIRGVENGSYDVCARPIPISTELRTRISFSEPLLVTKQVLVQHIPTKNDSVQLIRNQLYLAQKTIHLSAGSVAHYRIKNLIQEIGDTIYIINEKDQTDESLMEMVQNRTIRLAVVDEFVAQEYIQHFDSLDIKTPISFSQLQAWASSKKSRKLSEKLDDFFIKIKENGELDRLLIKYKQK